MDIVAVVADAARASLGPLGAAYALAAIGLNLHYGYTGLLNFGHIAFLMVGAYGTAITVDQGGPFWLGILVGVVAAVLLGLLFGLPTLRLRVDYLAIVTIAGGEVLRTVIRAGGKDSLTGGVFGITALRDGVLRHEPLRRWRVRLGAARLHGETALGRGRCVDARRPGDDPPGVVGAEPVGTRAAFHPRRRGRGPLARQERLRVQAPEPRHRRRDRRLRGHDHRDRAAVGPPRHVSAGRDVPRLRGPHPRRHGVAARPCSRGRSSTGSSSSSPTGSSRGAISAGWIPKGLLSETDVGPFRMMLVGLALMLLMIFRPQGLLGKREEVLLDAR